MILVRMDTSFDPTPDSGTSLKDAQPNGQPLAASPRSRPRATPTRVNLEIDLSPASCSPGYAPSRLDDITLNTTPQRVALKLLTASLTAHQTELIDGTRIARPQHAIQWLLEQVAIRLPSQLLDQLMEEAQ